MRGKRLPAASPNRLRRTQGQSADSKERIYALPASSAVCNLAVAEKELLVVISTFYARMDDEILVHNLRASSVLGAPRPGQGSIWRSHWWMCWPPGQHLRPHHRLPLRVRGGAWASHRRSRRQGPSPRTPPQSIAARALPDSARAGCRRAAPDPVDCGLLRAGRHEVQRYRLGGAGLLAHLDRQAGTWTTPGRRSLLEKLEEAPNRDPRRTDGLPYPALNRSYSVATCRWVRCLGAAVTSRSTPLRKCGAASTISTIA